MTTREQKLAEALQMALEWIDAVPADVVASLPAMPGFDRDYVDGLLAKPPVSENPVSSFPGLAVEFWNPTIRRRDSVLLSTEQRVLDLGFDTLPTTEELVAHYEAQGKAVGRVMDLNTNILYDGTENMDAAVAKYEADLLAARDDVPADFNGYHVEYWSHDQRRIIEEHFPNAIDVLKRGFTDGWPDAETFAEDLFNVFGDTVGTVKDNAGVVLYDKIADMNEAARMAY